MAQIVSYQCPSCGGDLRFSPDRQKFACEFCGSEYTAEKIKELYPEGDEEPRGEAQAQQSAQTGQAPPQEDGEDEFSRHAVAFSCPNCGAQVMTTDTTAATECYYCHNPVVLKGRLSGEMRPQLVIPFAVSKKEVQDKFVAWCHSKWFLTNHFARETQLEKVQGVYLPFWLADCTCQGSLQGTGTNLREWRRGDTIYTEHKQYEVVREGTARFSNIPQLGLNKVDEGLVNGIWPYHLEKVEEFSMSYLSGFLAEQYNRSKEELLPVLNEQSMDYTQNLLRDTVEHYDSFRVDWARGAMTDSKWRYALFPVWLLNTTYRGKPYSFAVNGQTGAVYGTLPLSPYRLAILFGSVAVGVFLLLFLLGGMLG